MGKGSSKRPFVISRHGRYRYQTGIVTAELLQRGIQMDLALQLSRQLRREIEHFDEISSDALEQKLSDLAREILGEDLSDSIPRTQSPPLIITQHGTFPFSRGILLRSLLTSGLDLEPAMAMASDILRWLRSVPGQEIDENHIEEEVSQRLRAGFGPAHARRFRLSGWLRRQDRPVIILISGATGSGKSTLAAELSFRLGIRSVTSTDMSRETMRAVLSPDITPGLYDHSFQGVILGGRVLSNPRERVLAGFRQQAAQVTVGIRAVIRRTIKENNHMIIEGTHLIPPFTNYLPPGSDALLAGLVLAVPEEDRHRMRFPKRARKASRRGSSTYLDAFQSVRWIHDDLLRLAEESDAMVIANAQVEHTVSSAIGYLAEALPLEKPPVHADQNQKTLFMILDGLADEPNPALDNQTPLAAAETPNLSCLAATGALGVIQTGAEPGLIPETSEGLQALLSTSQASVPIKRGLLEALGQGIPLPAGAVLLRGNFATQQAGGGLTDRRAGRIRIGTHELLRALRSVQLSGGIRGHIFPSHEHRVVVMLVGNGLSDAISDTDPGSSAPVQHVLKPMPTEDTQAARKTANALAELLSIAHKHLNTHPLNAEKIRQGVFPANCIITRGAASTDQLPDLGQPTRGVLVTGCGTALGVARAIGLQPVTAPKLTGNLDTDLPLKFNIANQMLGEHDLVVVHVKGTDIAAHDQLPLQKRDFISKVDGELGELLRGWSGSATPLRVVVTADHGTSSLTGNHIADPVPLLVGSWEPSQERARFDEQSAQSGAIGLLRPGELAGLLGFSPEAPSPEQSFEPAEVE